MSFRIEKKIKIHKSQLPNFNKWVIDNNIKKLYPERKIISLYYDNINKQMFKDSIEGVLPRKKIRIRFYPNDIKKKFSLETKISSFEGRFKKTINYPKENYGKNIFDKNYGNCYPIIEISYLRNYFFFKDLRITLDKNIQIKRYSESSKIVNLKEICLEIKAHNNFPQDQLEQLIQWEEIRYSKYCKGIGVMYSKKF